MTNQSKRKLSIPQNIGFLTIIIFICSIISFHTETSPAQASTKQSNISNNSKIAQVVTKRGSSRSSSKKSSYRSKSSVKTWGTSYRTRHHSSGGSTSGDPEDIIWIFVGIIVLVVVILWLYIWSKKKAYDEEMLDTDRSHYTYE